MKAKSDHHSFFEKDIPVLMLHTGLHDDYHRPSDDAHKINHEGASQTARLLFSILTNLADQPQRLAFRTESRFEGVADQNEFHRPTPPRPPRLGASWRKVAGDMPAIQITAVQPGTPAWAADLRVGDRVLRFAGQEVSDEFQLRRDVLRAQSPVEIVVQRSQFETLEVQVDLAGNPLRLGVSWRGEPAAPGVVMLSEVTAGSVADEAGLEVGDRIYQFAGQDFFDSDELLRLVSTTSGPVELLIEREGRIRSILLELPPEG
jgi:S1-C subfamily serine protease